MFVDYMFRYLLSIFFASAAGLIDDFFSVCFSSEIFFFSVTGLDDTSRSSCTCALNSSIDISDKGRLRRFNSGASSKEEVDEVLFVIGAVVCDSIFSEVVCDREENVLNNLV